MAIALTYNGNFVKLTLAGCTGVCSKGHDHFERYYWNMNDRTRVNIVGRLCILHALDSGSLDEMKIAFENGFNKYPADCAGQIWTDWNKVFFMHESSGIDVWKYLIAQTLGKNKKWIPCPTCIATGRSFDKILYIDPSFGTCPDHK